MKIFVGYARRDYTVAALRNVERIVEPLGSVYIDDLHAEVGHDRLAQVREALETAEAFIGIHSGRYLRTPWTSSEFAFAVARRLPLIAMLPNGDLATADSTAWPWHSLVATVADWAPGWPPSEAYERRTAAERSRTASALRTCSD